MILISLAALILPLSLLAQTRVIAHRGYWNVDGGAQNSIAALKGSAKIGVYGSEFDVLITKDGVLVVNHDDTIDGKDIQSVDYSTIQDCQLINGEKLPTLASYLMEGKRHKRLKLILELKPHHTKELEDRAVDGVLSLLKELKIEDDQMQFISFSINICKRFASKSQILVSYLGSDITPKVLYSLGIDGIDTHYKTLKNNRAMISDSKKLGMIVNSWTINDLNIAKDLLLKRVDFLTTDYPEEILVMTERML